MGIVSRNFRNNAGLRKRFRITRCDAGAFCKFPIETRQLRQQYCRLKSIKTTVHSQNRVLVPFDATMRSDSTHSTVQCFIVGKKRTSVAVATERLGGKETSATHQRRASAATTALRGSEALRRIGDDRDTTLSRDSIDTRVIGHLAKQIHGHNRSCPGSDYS